MTAEIKKEINENESLLKEINESMARVNAEILELRFKFISEEIYSWINKDGCLQCNGTGIARPWGKRSPAEDSIICPACDGKTPRHALSFCNVSDPLLPSFPDADYYALDCARALGLQIAQPSFWTRQRLDEKASLEKKLLGLSTQKRETEDKIYNLKHAASKVIAQPVEISLGPSDLPPLHGVSERQVNYGVACRRAAIESGKTSPDEIASIKGAVHWIECYKHLAGPRRR